MGLFGSSDPTVKQEKLINKEAKNDEKALKSAIKDVSSTEKDERHALKQKGAATEAYEKAMKQEQKLHEELTKLTAKHEAAVSHVKAMEKEVQIKTEAHQRAYDLSHKTKGDLESLQKENQGHEAERQRRLNQLHGTVAAAAGGDGVLRDINGNPAHGPDARGISQPTSEAGSRVNVAPVAAGTAAGAGAGVAGAEAFSHQGTAAPITHTDAAIPQTHEHIAASTSTTGANTFAPPPSHPSIAGSAPGSVINSSTSPAVSTGPSAATGVAHTTDNSALGTAGAHTHTTTEGQTVAEAVRSM